MSHAADPNPLTYATGAPSSLSRKGWRILFWGGLVHSAALLIMLAITSRGFVSLISFLRGVSVYNWYVIGTLIINFGVPILVLANGLAVMGYWTALQGRSPRPWFLIYAPVQLALMVMQYALTIPLVMYSPYKVSPTSSIGLNRVQLIIIPIACVLVALPFWLLLIPKIRRACFAA